MHRPCDRHAAQPALPAKVPSACWFFSILPIVLSRLATRRFSRRCASPCSFHVKILEASGNLPFSSARTIATKEGVHVRADLALHLRALDVGNQDRLVVALLDAVHDEVEGAVDVLGIGAVRGVLPARSRARAAMQVSPRSAGSCTWAPSSRAPPTLVRQPPPWFQPPLSSWFLTRYSRPFLTLSLSGFGVRAHAPSAFLPWRPRPCRPWPVVFGPQSGQQHEAAQGCRAEAEME